jgi:hypothetical protein
MSEKPDNAPPGAVTYHYIKGNFFRVVHVDGAIGGLTPNRSIFLSLFSERGAIPQMIEQALNPDGTLGVEKKRVGKEGLVREVEVGAMLSGPAAKRIGEWLLKQVDILEASEPQLGNEPLQGNEPQQGLVGNGDASPLEEQLQ